MTIGSLTEEGESKKENEDEGLTEEGEWTTERRRKKETDADKGSHRRRCENNRE
jgi:hypothetical protein